jgi:putative endonuclease
MRGNLRQWQAGSGRLFMSYKVYAIKSLKDNRIYVGMSENPIKRVREHNNKQVFSTKGYTPWKIFYIEDCGDDRKIARQREKYLKSYSGKEFLKRFLVPR